MRQDARVRQNVNIAGVQGYHGCRHYDINYAFQGFTGNWYFNSDRKEKTVMGEDGILRRDNGQPFMGYGLEVELQCNGITRQAVLAECLEKIIFPHFKFGADMFKMQNDCTLGGRSNAEVITQIMTKLRIRNDYSAWKAMFDVYFPAFDIMADSHETTCGMHVNVSNAVFGKTTEKQIDNIRKLYYLINKHYDLMVRALYRDPNKTDWCGRMDYSEARNFDLYDAPSSHGNCFNASHFPEGRIEIRLVGGQKDFWCFRNTMETVFFLCERVKALKWEELDNLATVFKGCNQYVYKRLSTECASCLTLSELEEIRDNVKTEDLDF